MKTLKRKVRNTCLILGLLLLGANAYSQTNITVTNGGTYYLCQGIQNNITFFPDSATYNVASIQSWKFNNSTTYCTADGCSEFGLNDLNWVTNGSGNGDNEMQITSNLTSLSGVTVYIAEEKGTSAYFRIISFQLITYQTSISGAVNYCSTNNETYTCTSNTPGITTYSWVPTGFQTTVGGQGTSSYTVSSTGGTGTMSVTVTNTSGCASGSPSIKASYSVVASAAAPTAAPTSLTYDRFGVSCFYDGQVNAITGAYQYEWGRNSSFTPPLYSAGYYLTDKTDDQPFDANTTYTVYVRATNACGNGPTSTEFIQTTPDPTGCLHGPIKTIGLVEGFKVYPNPVNSKVTIEYPTYDDNTVLSLDMYDMLGHKLTSYNLPISENRVTEDVSGLPKGLYLYVITSGNDILTRGKIMVQR